RRRRFEISVLVDQTAGAQRLQPPTQQRNAGLGELTSDFPSDPRIAQRALQRHFGQIALGAGVLELELQEAENLSLDAAAGRRLRAAALVLPLAELLDQGEEQSLLPAEIALNQLL